MEDSKVVLKLRLELVELQRKFLEVQAEALGLKHALLGIDQKELAQALEKLSPEPPTGAKVVVDEGPMKGLEVGTFQKN